jgi:hypothetical protein
MSFRKSTNNIYFILLITFLLVTCRLRAQDWPKVYGDNFDGTISNIEEVYDHGFLLSAYTYASSGWPLYDWIIKIDINGNVLWEKRFGHGSYSNGVTDSKITSDNGIIIAASTSKYSGNYDPTFIKLNVCGELEWCRVFQSPDHNYGTGILQLSNGSYIGMLQYYGEGDAYARISLVKMDQTGEPIWIQRLAQEDTLIYNEEGNYLYLTCDSNYLVSGHAYHPGKHPFWIKSDTLGMQIWDLFWNSLVGQAHQVIEKDTGIYYSTGWGIGSGRPQSPVLMKFDRNGNPIDMYFLMGDTISGGSASGIDFLNDTNLIIGIAWKSESSPVQNYSEVFLTDTLGNALLRRFLLNEFNVPNQTIKTSDNKIIVSGNYVTDNNWDIYLWKMNTNLEDDTLYTQPLTYDSLCPYEIQSDTVDLDCGIFVNIDELPTKEVYESIIKISPNPARDWIAISFPENVSSGPNEIAIFNLFGQAVIKNKVSPQNNVASLNISNLPPGIYLAKFKDSTNKNLTGKFVVVR